MKIVAIVALVLALGGVGVAAYHLVETYPRVKYHERTQRHDSGRYRGRYRGRLARLELAVQTSVRRAAFNQVYAMWVLGGLALILGIVAAIKSPLKKVGVVAIVAAVAVLVVSLTTIMWSRLG
ncbi:MAG: hypothetical protein KC609_03020 [Myxococcales bacterium]|nr:hypothetical protein [Myxococcales bacterium]